MCRSTHPARPLALAAALVAAATPGTVRAGGAERTRSDRAERNRTDRTDDAKEIRNEIAEQIRAEIQSALPAELSAVEVRVPGSLAGAAAEPVAIDWRRPARPGWLTLRVRLGDRSGWVRARLAAVAPAVVAVRDLAAGHVVAEADIRLEMRPVAADAGSTIGLLEGAVGRALRQPVAAGAPLSPGALERAAPLPRGHQLTARVRRGRLSISAAAVLERPAAIGQATSARLLVTGRTVRGRLIDSQTMLVEVSP